MLQSNGYNTAQMGKWGLRHNYSDAVKEGMKPGSRDAYDFPDKFTYSRVQNYKHYSMGQWRGIKRDAWEGGNRTPFIIRWPGKVKPNTVNDTQFCLTDMMATFAEIAGATLTDSAGEDSFSILSLLLEDNTTFNRPPVIYHNTRGKMGIRVDDWVYIDAPSGAVEEDPDWFKKERGVIAHKEKVELFNLSEDPQQLINLAPEHPEKVKELKLMLDEMIE